MNVKKIVAILLAVVAVVMIGFGIYTMNSSKYIFKTALSGIFDKAVDSYDEMTDELENMKDFDKYKLTTSNTVTVSGMDLATLTGDMYVNSKDNSMYLNLDSNIMNESFIGIEGLLSDNKLYAKVKEVMDNFYYEDIEESISGVEVEELKDDEFELMMNHLKNSILKDITDKDLDKSSSTIKLDGKDVKTTKVSLKITEKRIYEITENLLTSISKDKKAIQVLQKFEKSITKDTIDDLLKELKEHSSSLSNDEIMTLSFYVQGFGGLKRVEVATKSQDVDSVVNNVIVSFDMYKNSHKNKTYLLTVKSAGMELLSLKEEYTTDTKANIVLKIAELEVNGTLEEGKNSVTLNLNLMAEGEKLGTFNYKDTVVKEDKEYMLELSINIQDAIQVTSTNTLLIGENIPDVDVSDAVLFDEMTEEDMQELEDYIMDKLEKVGLDQLFTTNDDEWETEEDVYDDSWDSEYSSDDEAYDTFWYEEISVDDIKDLMDSTTPTILWMGSQSCSYCVDFAEVLDDSYFDYDYDIYYIDVDELTEDDVNTLKEIDSRLGNITTPTTLVLQDGEVKEIKRGAMTKDEYYSFLDSYGIE